MATEYSNEKLCSKCKLSKPVSNFYPDRNKKGGLSSWCRECHKEYKKEHSKEIVAYQKRRMNIRIIGKNNRLDILKVNGCAICGYNKCQESLDFHHVLPEDKKFHVNFKNMELSSTRIINEVNKCILLCKNCHTEIHYKHKYD